MTAETFLMGIGGALILALTVALVLAVLVVIPALLEGWSLNKVRRAFDSVRMWRTVHEIAIRAKKRNGVTGIPFTRDVLLKAEELLLEESSA